MLTSTSAPCATSRLVADEGAEFRIAGRKRRAGSPFVKGAHSLRESRCKGKYRLKWNVFAEGHEMDFVVTTAPLASGADGCCGVVSRTRIVDADRSHDDPCVRLSCQIADGVPEKRVIDLKWRR